MAETSILNRLRSIVSDNQIYVFNLQISAENLSFLFGMTITFYAFSRTKKGEDSTNTRCLLIACVVVETLI